MCTPPENRRKRLYLLSICEQRVRSWTGIEPINSRATIQKSNSIFFGNYSRTTRVPLATTSFSEPWQKTPVAI
jgi:hypothetical protein